VSATVSVVRALALMFEMTGGVVSVGSGSALSLVALQLAVVPPFCPRQLQVVEPPWDGK